MDNRADVYWAAALKADIGKKLVEKLKTSTPDFADSRGAQYQTAYRNYYPALGNNFKTSNSMSITRDGDQGELAAIVIAKGRAIAKSLLAMMLGTKLTWRCQAANNDPNIKAATILATARTEWRWKRQKMNRVVHRLTEKAIIFSEGFALPEWDMSKGPDAGLGRNPITGQEQLLKEGDLVIHTVLPWDVRRDLMAKSYEELTWRAAPLLKNKWDLIALTPVDILGEPTRDKILSAGNDNTTLGLSRMGVYTKDSDLIPVWHFFHDPTPSLPAGRQTVFVSADCVLSDGPLPFDSSPMVRLASDEQYDTPYGYSSWWDCLAVQELMDGLESSIATNQLTLGTQSIAMEQGTTTPADFVHGMKAFYYPKGGKPPGGINMTSTPREMFEHLKQKTSDQQQLLGLNDVYRGQPDTAQMNAQAFALLAATAVQQNSPLQGCITDAISELGTVALKFDEKYVSNERQVAISGRGNKYLYQQKSFKGSDFKPIEGVFVEIGNPLEQTVSGRLELLNLYKELQLIKTPDDVQQIVDSGRLDPVIQPIRDAQMLIAYENDELSAGNVPIVSTFDDALAHCRQHKTVIDNQEGRNDPKVVNAFQQHFDMHYVEYFGLPDGMPPQADPMYMQRKFIMLGQQPPPMMAPPGMAGTQSISDAPAPGMGQNTTVPPEAMGGLPPNGPDVAPPKNPLNGQPVNPAEGSAPPPMA